MTAPSTEPEAIRSYIRDLVCELMECEPDEVTDSASFTEELEVDSLTAIEMLVLIDKHYGIDIPDEEFREVENLDQSVALVQKYLSQPVQEKAS
ncbi:MAG TPA: acyl carrier protein [Acidobacteriota bacterium]|nr:acyl carrier protein [Acidobacteriota bacterium]